MVVKAQIVRRRRTRREQLRAAMEQMVHERVDEILAQRDGELLLEGEFLSKTLSAEITRRTPLWERRKWALYFAEWGCRQCKRKRLTHTGLGYCANCFGLVRSRLATLKKHWDAEHPQHPPEVDAIDEKIRTAKRVFTADESPE